jgi:hypothetical protein
MSYFFPRISEFVRKFSANGSNEYENHYISEESDEEHECNVTKSVRIRRKNAKVIRHQVFEICLSDIESARNAIQGGASSLELCFDRSQGGVTPSIGFVRQCVHLCKGTNVEVNVLVRPRPGFFTYSHEEFDVILRDIIAFERAGVTGTSLCLLSNTWLQVVDRFLWLSRYRGRDFDQEWTD